ncbi:unnamed protein product [Arabis nemorensis]|uniref:Uncharacterized protein n=1 Tax=Arabis nemorensis TaxID=586526 RepID=A0A565BL38_9BRAS|nr:unnamed protein product [Arabis nemorensis]
MEATWHTLHNRYKPEVGDIVVGRITEVGQKRWRVELNSTLAFMTIPDGGLKFCRYWKKRRRTSEDELNMRNIFAENDVICAEVHEFQRDGSLIIHARSQKYGKLLKVDPYLVKRSNHHFHYVESLGIDLILGCNGFIWVGEHVEFRNHMIVTNNTGMEQSPYSTRD